MQRPALLVTAVVAMVMACAATPPRPAGFAPADDAAIRALLARQIAAWNHGDLDGYMDAYARIPGLVFTSGSRVRRGWQATLEHYRARYATDPAAMGTLGFAIDTIDAAGGDGAVVLGRWDLVGSAHPGRGVFTLVLARRPEGWRIIHDHTSSAPAD